MSMIAPMTEGEARACVASIKGHVADARRQLLDLVEREGWRALGYPSWRECVVAEFGQSQTYLYYQLSAAKTERNLLADPQISTIVETHPIPEGQLRPLASLKDAGEQREAYRQAMKTAPEGRMTAAHVERTVAEYRAPRIEPDGVYVPLSPRAVEEFGTGPAREHAAAAQWEGIVSLLYRAAREGAELVRHWPPEDVARLLPPGQHETFAPVVPLLRFVTTVLEAQRAMESEGIRRVK